MKMTTKKFTAAMLAVLTILVGCASEDGTRDTNPDDMIEISSEGVFTASQCETHNPEYEVIMLESKYCGHCQATLPAFLEACEEKGITPVVLDLSVQEDRQRMEGEYKLTVQYTPTFIFGCKYFIGTQPDKESYIGLLEEYEVSRGEN